MRLLANGKPWRVKHLTERAAQGARPAAVSDELAKLWDEGRIAKVRWGVWALAGKPTPKARDIPPLHRDGVGGPTGRKVLERLGALTPAPTLVQELGVTRQRIDQILKLLLAQGKVARFPEPGVLRRWLWVRSEVKPKNVPRRRIPLLAAGPAEMLNLMEAGAWHRVVDVVAAARQRATSAAKNVRVLEARGLVVMGRAGQFRTVGMTQRGLQHPSREEGHAHAPAAGRPEGSEARRDG